MVTHLDEADVPAVLQWDELIPCMEMALVAFSTGRVQQPVRTCLRTNFRVDKNWGYLPHHFARYEEPSRAPAALCFCFKFCGCMF